MDDLAKETSTDELLLRIERYERHLETARRNAVKYYERNKDAIRAKNAKRYKSEFEVRERARKRYHEKKLEKLQEKMNELSGNITGEIKECCGEC
jgi:hypothetical protein